MNDDNINKINHENTPDNPGNYEENANAVENMEAFLEEQVNGDIPEETSEAFANEEVEKSPNESKQEEETPPVYVWNTQPGEGKSEDSTNHPPQWEEHNAAAPYINMQVEKKKKRKWVITVIVCAVLAYILLTGVIVFGILHSVFEFGIRHPFRDRDKNIFDDNRTPQVEEHLHINPTPDDEEPPYKAGEKLTVKQIAKKVRSSVVGVVAEGNMNFSSSSVGSGIIMNKDGYIITNNHVIENMTKISVVTDDGKKHNASVIGTDSRTDLAVIKVEATDLPAAEFGDSDLLEQGDLAVAIGNPAGIQLQNTVTSGIISAINRNIVVEDEEMTLIQTDASINPGNSGGPLVNEYGQVVGINTVKIGISYYEGLGFAIPINTAKPIIDELISRGYITGRPSIGISGMSISERDAAFYGLKAGMYVEFVHPYSDAYKKGLQAGDVITEMNGTPLQSTEEIKKIRDEYKAGDSVKIKVYRQGREFELSVLLMDEAELNKIGQPSSRTN